MRQASAGLLVLFLFMAAVLAPFFIGCVAQRPLRPELVTPCGVCPAHTDQIAAPPSHRRLAPGDNPPLRGFADYHAHMFTN